MTTIVIRVGGLLKACRERAGLKQEELADKLYMSQSTISKYETGRKKIDIPTFIQWIQTTQTQDLAFAFMFGMDGLTAIQSVLPHLSMLIGG